MDKSHAETAGRLIRRQLAIAMAAIASATETIPEYGQEKRTTEAADIANDYNPA